jgi:hypothetical protein
VAPAPVRPAAPPRPRLERFETRHEGAVLFGELLILLGDLFNSDVCIAV